MSGSAGYLARLHAAVAPVLTSPHAALALRRQAGAVDDATDFLAAAADMLPLILGMEEAADALSGQAKKLRQSLAEVLSESGAPGVRGEFHTASVSEGRAAVLITDPSAIPAELMRVPPPAPDKAAIQKLLKEGKSVPGATLGNGAPASLTIRSREK